MVPDTVWYTVNRLSRDPRHAQHLAHQGSRDPNCALLMADERSRDTLMHSLGIVAGGGQ